MPRLKHVATGVIVNVSDEKAAVIGGGAYVPVEESKEPAKPKRAASSDEK